MLNSYTILFPRTTRLSFALIVFLVVTGCGKKNRLELSGKVTFDGKLVESGEISFNPLDGKSATAGTTIVNGHYSLGVPEGRKRVAIQAYRYEISTEPSSNPALQGPSKTAVPILPSKYNTASILEMVIGPDSESKLDFNLSSK